MSRSTVGRSPVTTGASTTGASTTGAVAVRTAVLAALLDACCVLVFVAIGRDAHHNGDSLAGLWRTAWPFLAGLPVGLAAARYWRRPQAIAPAGVGAWLGAARLGMAIRVLAGQGTAAAFIIVAAAFLALFLLGWRGIATVASHLWRKSHSYAQRG